MISVIWAGRTRDPGLAPLVARYAERVARYAPFRLLEVGAGRGAAAADDEDRKVAARLPERARVVALEAGGKALSSEGFAGWLGKALASGSGEIAFVLGGHAGLGETVLGRARDRLSLSPMTLTHEMARVLFLEQLYRAFTILRGEQYHH
jgi:23S rRNA (pseudouridine1915-N3)-methyltransferase